MAARRPGESENQLGARCPPERSNLDGVHVPSKSASMLVGLFVTGVLLGALYAWSGTNVAGYVLHALANSGSGGAVIMFVLCLVLGVGGRLIERRTGRDLAPDGDAHDQ